MNDKDFLNHVEKSVFETMLEGCFIEAHLGYEKYNPGNWQVRLNAEEVARLLDMAKAKTKEKNT
jgi:hypothetical protein